MNKHVMVVTKEIPNNKRKTQDYISLTFQNQNRHCFKALGTVSSPVVLYVEMP